MKISPLIYRHKGRIRSLVHYTDSKVIAQQCHIWLSILKQVILASKLIYIYYTYIIHASRDMWLTGSTGQ